jgi:hypothetical protein
VNLLNSDFQTAVLNLMVAAEAQDVYVEEIVFRECVDAKITDLGKLYGTSIKMKTVVRDPAPKGKVVHAQGCICGLPPDCHPRYEAGKDIC